MPNRSTQLENWLLDMSLEKTQKIVELERAARLLKHVKELTGDVDQQLLARLFDAEGALRTAYEEKL